MSGSQLEGGPWRRSDLVTHGFHRNEIPGVVPDTQDFGKTWAQIEAGMKETYTHEEVYGEYCPINLFIAAPVEMVFDYIANPYSLEEYTATMRNIVWVAGDIYKCQDLLAPNTPIFIQNKSYRDSGVVDCLCAWDQGDELWMRYHMRVVDGMRTVNKPGSVLFLINAKHPYYDRSYPAPPHIAAGRDRKDRDWVGDFWRFFAPGHGLEIQNLKHILEYRWRNAPSK